MFKLKELNVVWWPVIINEPADGGTTTEHKCQVQFALVSQDEFDKLASCGDTELLHAVVKDWKELIDENDEPLEFTETNVDALLQLPYVRAGIIQAYLIAVSGSASTDSALVKN